MIRFIVFDDILYEVIHNQDKEDGDNLHEDNSL